MMDGYTKQEMMRRFGLTVALSLAVIFMVTPAAWSMGRAGTCEGDPDGSNASIGACMEDMLSNQLMMLDEVEGMILDMSSMGLFSLGRSQSGVDIQAELAIRRNDKTAETEPAGKCSQ